MNNLQRMSTNAFIINKNNEVLLLLRSIKDDAFPGEWELGGGGILYKETPEQSLIREIKEECGLDLDIKIPLTINIFYIKNVQHFEITYFCELKDENQKIQLSSEHSDFKWLNLKDINSSNLTPYIISVLVNAKKSLDYHISINTDNSK